MTSQDEKKPVATPDEAKERPGKKTEAEHSKKTREDAAAGNAKVAALEEQLSDEKKKNSELKETLLRTAAEYENYRKRSQKENAGAFNDGAGHAVQELLPVLDTLEAAANAETADGEYKKGVLLILAKAEEVFKKLGICEIEAMGQPFDPAVHNAVMQQPAEGAESGTVTQVIQKGYMLGDKVIRHAMVAVAP